MANKKIAQLVLLPAPAAGHRVSALEFGRRLLERDDRLTVTILLIKFPGEELHALDIDSDGTSSVQYIILPEEPPPAEQCPQTYMNDIIDSYKLSVKDAIADLINSRVPVAGLVLDMFCCSMIDVAKELSVASYVFFTSGAGFLGLLFHLLERDREYLESDTEDSIMSCFKNPFPIASMPEFLFRKIGYLTFTDVARRCRETKGVVVNTFVELEPYAVNSLLGNLESPVYTVGPVLDLAGQAHGKPNAEQGEKIMRWLDAQPESSVVFLCFGSLGFMGEAHAREVVVGLMRSGVRFLWSVRKPPSKEDGLFSSPTEYSSRDLEEILPREFLRILEEGRGFVSGWAPQVEVLAHDAIAGFVSHCGWNSTLESLWFGRAMITWPMYAEQMSNAFQLVREMGLAVEMRLSYNMRKGEVVVGEELERGIRCLMEEAKGNEVRERVREMGEMSRRVLMEGGSSFNALGRFIDDVLSDRRI